MHRLSFLKDLLKTAKLLCHYYYVDNQFTAEYLDYVSAIKKEIANINNSYICDTTINANKDFEQLEEVPYLYKIKKDIEITKILDYIAYKTREQIISVPHYFNICAKIDNLNSMDVTNYCELACLITSKICLDLGIPCYTFKIDMGFDKQALLYDGSGYHYFNVISIYGQNFLMDCTYKQFFRSNAALLERLGVPLVWNPSAGAFMMLDESRMKVANEILKNGYILIDEQTFKCYCDGFALAARNGLYYENLDKICFETDYTAQDYFNFLTTDDSQFRREKQMFLGIQKKPLNKRDLNFTSFTSKN